MTITQQPCWFSDMNEEKLFSHIVVAMTGNTYIWAILTLMVFIWFCPKYNSFFFWSDTHCSVWIKKKKLTFTKSQEHLLLILLHYDASVPCGSWEDSNVCRNKTVGTDTDRDRQSSDIMAYELCNYHRIYSCSIMQDFYGPITGLVTASTSFSFGCAQFHSIYTLHRWHITDFLSSSVLSSHTTWLLNTEPFSDTTISKLTYTLPQK